MYNGRNVTDFIDPDIEAKLEALEAEEEQLEASGFYDEAEEIEDEEEAEIRTKADYIKEQQQLIRNAARSKKALKNRAIIPRTKAPAKKLSEMEKHFDKIGVDSSAVAARARGQSRGRSVARGDDVDMMDIDEAPSTSKVRAKSSARESKQKAIERAKSRARSQNRRDDGIQDTGAKDQANKMAKLHQKKMNRMARQGESDRHTTASLPKHLFSGKRGIGSTRSR